MWNKLPILIKTHDRLNWCPFGCKHNIVCYSHLGNGILSLIRKVDSPKKVHRMPVLQRPGGTQAGQAEMSGMSCRVCLWWRTAEHLRRYQGCTPAHPWNCVHPLWYGAEREGAAVWTLWWGVGEYKAVIHSPARDNMEQFYPKLSQVPIQDKL